MVALCDISIFMDMLRLQSRILKFNKISTVQIPPPKNWQDFESLCRDLWARIWGDKNTTKHGRNGQNQNGVDVVGRDLNGSREYCGVQCKGKDNYADKKLTVAELEREVENAKGFNPKLGLLVLATSGPKDVAVERRAREITAKHEADNLFQVVVMGWLDILDRLDEYETIQRHYYPWMFGQPRDSGFQLYQYWSNGVGLSNFAYHCCALPNFYSTPRVSEEFIDRLASYLAKIGRVMQDYVGLESASRILDGVSNFNRVGRDLLITYSLQDNKYISGDVYEYSVDTSHLPEFQRDSYESYKELVLKQLFYELVKAANHIVGLRNENPTGTFEAYVPFRQDEYSSEFYPFYTDEQVVAGKLYGGYYEVDCWIRLQVYAESKIATVAGPIPESISSYLSEARGQDLQKPAHWRGH